jgi:hypothetical protein
MSEQKKFGVVATKNNGMALQSNNHKSKKLYVKLAGVGFLIFIVLVSVITSALYLKHKHNSSSGSLPKQAVTSKPKTVIGLLLTGDDSGAQKMLDTQIAAATTKSQKGGLYLQKAGIAYDAKEYENGLQFAQQAESLNPTAGSAGLIGNTASALGDKTLAVQYYKLQLQRMQPVVNQDDANRVQAKINALQSNI